MVDQGNIALYFVDTFLVDNCLLENSHSDGTHFYKSINGEFNNNRVLSSKMGGYFIEECSNVAARNNTVDNNGSRGVSFEVGTNNCSLENCRVSYNGREGFWGNNAYGCILTNNSFIENGRKDDAMLDSNILFTDREWPVVSPAHSYGNVVAGNTIVTLPNQMYAIWLAWGVRDSIVRENILLGDNHLIRADSWLTGVGKIDVYNNTGWVTENTGTTLITGDGQSSRFKIAHGLDLLMLNDYYNSLLIKNTCFNVQISTLPLMYSDFINVSTDLRYILLDFRYILPANAPITVNWAISVEQAVQ